MAEPIKSADLLRSAKNFRWALVPQSKKPLPDDYKKGGHQAWLEGQALDFAKMPDVQAGAQRIADAIRNGEIITLSGDYDCDGNCATAIMRRFLLEAGVPNDHIRVDIPNRAKDGYGFNERAANDAIAAEPRTDLVITLDNGTKAHAAIQVAMDAGIDVLVIDHHPNGPTDDLPAASDGKRALVVNPCRADTPANKFTSLAAGGVTLLMTQCVHTLLEDYYAKREPAPRPNPTAYTSIATLATVADVVNIGSRINRTLIKYGLESIRAGENKAISAMAKLVGKSPLTLTSEDIAFSIAPPINASGRIDQSIGWDLLSSEYDPNSLEQTKKFSKQIDDNNKRKQIEAELMSQAQQQAREQVAAGETILFVGGKGWHEGVIGIVAGRIKEEFGRPVIAYSELEDGHIKCSARNLKVPEHQTDLGQALSQLAKDNGPLTKAGGHIMAAGASLKAENLGRFKHDLRAALGEQTQQMIAGYSSPVSSVITLKDDLQALIKAHEKHQPFGEGNPRPRVVLADVRVMDGSSSAGANNRHQIDLTLCEANPEDAMHPYKIKANAFHVGGTALEKALIAAKGKHTPCLLLGTLQFDPDHPSSLVFHIEDMVAAQHRGQSTAWLIQAMLGSEPAQQRLWLR